MAATEFAATVSRRRGLALAATMSQRRCTNVAASKSRDGKRTVLKKRGQVTEKKRTVPSLHGLSSFFSYLSLLLLLSELVCLLQVVLDGASFEVFVFGECGDDYYTEVFVGCA